MNDDFLQKWESQVKKGILSLLVLQIISRDEYYGYELIEEIRNRTNIDIAEGTLYPLLIRLKDEGLVSSRWVEQDSGIPRKYYKLTDAGAQTLGLMNTYWNNLYISTQKIK